MFVHCSSGFFLKFHRFIYLLQCSIVFILTMIFKSCSINSWVEMEAHSRFCQLSKPQYRSSLLPPLLALSRLYASVYILSSSSPFCSFMPHFSLPLSLSPPHSSLCIFSISTLYFVLLTVALSHFSILAPQASCWSSSSTVITAVLSTICSTTTLSLN